MVKITCSEVKSAHSIDNDVLRAISSELTNEMQAAILGGQSQDDKMREPVQNCDAVCLPSEMGACHCYQNLA